MHHTYQKPIKFPNIPSVSDEGGTFLSSYITVFFLNRSFSLYFINSLMRLQSPTKHWFLKKCILTKFSCICILAFFYCLLKQWKYFILISMNYVPAGEVSAQSWSICTRWSQAIIIACSTVAVLLAKWYRSHRGRLSATSHVDKKKKKKVFVEITGSLLLCRMTREWQGYGKHSDGSFLIRVNNSFVQRSLGTKNPYCYTPLYGHVFPLSNSWLYSVCF